MKFHYYPETDSLYIELSEKPSANSQEAAPNVVLDFDNEGQLVGIDWEHFSLGANNRDATNKSLKPHALGCHSRMQLAGIHASTLRWMPYNTI